MIYWNKTGDTLFINTDTKQHVLRKGDLRYEEVLGYLRDKAYDKVENALNYKLEGGALEVNPDGTVMFEGEAMPEGIVKKITEFREEGLDFEPIRNFWHRLKKNPSFNSRRMLLKFLEHNGHPFTQDGKFIAYKGLNDDYTDCHTGKFDNSIGNDVRVSRDQVDDNPNNTCSFGLHVACFDYAQSFSSGQLVAVEVDPEDVVAVPEDYNGTKMRVCGYKVLHNVERIKTEPIHQDTLPNHMNEWECEQCLETSCLGECDDYEDWDNYGEEGFDH